MTDRAYLTEAVPMCVIWGEDDHVIPVRHARNAEALAPGCRVEVIPNAGHFPHKDHPQRFVKVVNRFLRTTQPSVYDRTRFRMLLEAGGDVPVQQAEAGHAPISPLRTLSGA